MNRDWNTDHTGIDQIANALMGCSKKSVGRTSNSKALFCRESQHLLAIFATDGEGLFVIDVLARLDRLADVSRAEAWRCRDEDDVRQHGLRRPS